MLDLSALNYVGLDNDINLPILLFSYNNNSVNIIYDTPRFTGLMVIASTLVVGVRHLCRVNSLISIGALYSIDERSSVF